MAQRKVINRDEWGAVLGRLDDLELRVKLMEARLRHFEPAARRADAPREVKGRPAKPRRARARPRCPGCTLELPLGSRGETCVWCGFHFDALPKTSGE